MIDILNCRITINIVNEYEMYEVQYKVDEEKNNFSFFLDCSYEIEVSTDYLCKCTGNCRYQLFFYENTSFIVIRYKKKHESRIAFFNQIVWLPIPIEVYKVEYIKIDTNLHNLRIGNIQGVKSVRLENLVIVEVNNDEVLFEVFNNDIVNGKEGVLGMQNTKEELQKLLSIYYDITNQKVSFICICNNNIIAQSVSYANLIVCDSQLMSHKNSAFYLYFSHELFHQVIGNLVIFQGPGKLWITEVFTEFLQLNYLRLRFGNSMFKKRCIYYRKVYEKYEQYEVEWNKIDQYTCEETFIATVASKGILVFAYLLRDCSIEELRRFILVLIGIRGEVDTMKFWELFEEKFHISEEMRNVKSRIGIDYDLDRWLFSLK